MPRQLITLICFLLTITTIFADESREDLFLSTPEQIATLTSEPTYLVGGLVSPLSGQLVLRQTDLVVKGAQNIVLSRTYIPPHMPCSFPQHKHNQGEHQKKYLYSHLRDNYKGWQFYPHLRLELSTRSMQVRLSEPSGMTLDFRLSGPNNAVTTLASAPYAISNMAGDALSGKHDPRNTRISYEEGGNRITVHAPDGTIRIYYKKNLITGFFYYLYLLEKEILLNGKVLKYHYNERGYPYCIESLDPKERFVYSSLTIAGMPSKGNCHFTSSSGLMVDYNYQQRPIHWKFKEKTHGSGKQREEADWACPPILTSVSSPFYRHEALDYCGNFLLSSYSGKEAVLNILHDGFGGPYFRVHKLFLPVGQTDALVPVYELSYQPPVAGKSEGTTTVRNSDGTSVIYHFSKNLLTTLIQHFDQEGELKKEKVFSWNEQNWLQTLEMQDGQKNLLYRKSYEYDRFGNPIVEIFTGDLTGDGSQGTFTTKRTFSEDGRNLLLQEESEDGKVICLNYLPNTNLVASKLTKDGGQIILREFSIYDDCNNLIQTIADDGSSEDKDNLVDVAQRMVKTYTLRQSAPFFHMPEWIEETYLESGSEKALKKSHLIYDQHGNIAQEEVYDAEGQHAYTICKTYNERGDVLTETNRLGQQATFTYDPKGRPETSTNFSTRVQKIFHHDTKGRLLELTEKGDDGVVHVVSSDYDCHDRKVQKTDSFQNATHYAYDPLVDEVIRTDFPPIASIDGHAVPVTILSTYDPFGRQLTKTDANGNTIFYRYSAYNAPVEVIHPDGGRETFRYTKKGHLSSYTNRDGLTIQYARDVEGRPLSKTYTSLSGETLAQETFTYSGFNLLTETDKEGNLTQYFYDGAGRKIREDRLGQVTDFSYDPLGRLSTICKHNADNTLFIHYENDLEGRVLEESKTDASGTILYRISYTYDEDGNKASTTRYINGQKSVNVFAYDSFGRLIEQKDPSSFVTRRSYDENHINPLGQKVLQTTIIDPLNVATIETRDALNCLVKKEILDPHGATLSSGELIYDPHGNLIYQKDHVYEKGQLINTQTIRYTYTPTHHIEQLTKAYGEKNANTTTYTYFHSGKVKTKTLPNDVTLSYEYHPLGFHTHLSSSDRTILHTFEYDNLGHLKYAFDERQNIAIERRVDPFGNVIQETFPSVPVVDKEYDDLNRLISLKIDGVGKVSYRYDALFLREVVRSSSNNEELYIHRYENYDSDGNLLSEKLIGNLGQLVHTTDLRGQKTAISSPYFSQHCSFDPLGNLIENLIDQAEYRYGYDGLSQLSLENGPNQSSIYTHDSLYNRTNRDGIVSEINDLNQLVSFGNKRCSYDLNGNQTIKQTRSEEFHLTYDPLDRLIEAASQQKKIAFTYDPLGRRLNKTTFIMIPSGWKETENEYYLYHGQHEIGAFVSPHDPKNLRVLGINRNNNPLTIAIELEGQIFAPILDVQDNVRGLIDFDSHSVASSYEFTAFGEELQKTEESLYNPWRFASKRFDPELALIYFGKRYYDPEFARWLTTDPAGFIDSANLYQYVFNNPFRYRDPDGQFAIALPLLIWGAELVLPALSAYVAPLVYGAITGAVLYGGYKAVEALNARDNSYSSADDYAEMQLDSSCEAKDKKKHNSNPFEGPVGDEVFVVDVNGNVIKVPENHQLGGSKDGKCIQVKDAKGIQTGTRMDGKGHSDSHTDPRAQQPHAHVPGVTNEDGTQWLPIH